MFERHRQHEAIKHFEEALATWQAQHDGYAELVATARDFHGLSSNEINLGPGELLFFKVSGAGLSESRQGTGHYEGRSSGISIPVASIGGHAVRYHVGASKGHYVQGKPVLTVIDHGTVYLTNRRVIFTGAKQTRECDFAKLINVEHDDQTGTTVLSVSNRQKPIVISYGPALAGAFDFRLDLALANFRGDTDSLLKTLEETLSAIDSHKPTPDQPS